MHSLLPLPLSMQCLLARPPPPEPHPGPPPPPPDDRGRPGAWGMYALVWERVNCLVPKCGSLGTSLQLHVEFFIRQTYVRLTVLEEMATCANMETTPALPVG